MKLSELVFNCIKNVKQLPETGFSYETFIRGDFDNDPDYVDSISNVFNPLNRAIHRLSDRRKIPFYTISVDFLSSPQISSIDVNALISNSTSLPHRVKNITNVVYFNSNGRYTNVSFRNINNHTIKLISTIPSNVKELIIEYCEDIPNFSNSDYRYATTEELEDDVEVNEYDVDLYEQYGINETMCSYIVDYVKGDLFETIDPSMASWHKNYAEQCFADLEEHGTAFNQDVVQKIYTVN